MRPRALVIATTAASILVACGGGGDGGASEPSPPPPPPATLTQGLYLGPSTSGSPASNSILVLRGGETWVNVPAALPGDAPFFAQGTAALLEQTSTKSGTTTGSVTAGQSLLAGRFGTGTALVSTTASMVLGTGPMSFTSDPTADGRSTFLTLAGQPKLHLATVQDDGFDGRGRRAWRTWRGAATRS